jgi:cation transport ATPase
MICEVRSASAVSALGMLIAAAGYLPPVADAVAQEIIDVAAVLNALRVVFPAEELAKDSDRIL